MVPMTRVNLSLNSEEVPVVRIQQSVQKAVEVIHGERRHGEVIQCGFIAQTPQSALKSFPCDDSAFNTSTNNLLPVLNVPCVKKTLINQLKEVQVIILKVSTATRFRKRSLCL